MTARKTGGGNITYDKINSCVRKRANVAAFVVHLEVKVSNRWTHHTCFSLCDCSSLSWNEKKDGFVYACRIWAAALVFVHTFSLCIVNLWVCFPLPQVWFCSSAGFQDCLDQRILIMNAVALLPVWWIAAVYIIPPLHTWWGNFPPRLIVAIKHTSVKYPHYCISVYVYILIWVDSSVWGAHQQLPSRWKLSPLSSSLRHFLHLFPFAFTPPLPHSRFRMLSSRVACFCTRSYETLAFVVSVRVSVTRCEHVCFTFGGKKSQVVMHVWDCGWLRLTWT